MDYKDAKLYLALYNSSSLTKAAHAIGMTQSAVTQRLQKLEREFGMKLVIRERGQKYVELTHYGRRMVPIIEQWVDLYESANSIKNEGVKTPLKVACTDSIGSYILPRFFLDYAQKHRDVMLSIHTSHSWEIFNMLEEGAIDVGITNRESSLYHNELKVMPIYREPYRLLTSQQNAREYENGPVRVEGLDVARELFFAVLCPVAKDHVGGQNAVLANELCPDAADDAGEYALLDDTSAFDGALFCQLVPIEGL